jgi:secreted PhoX family phosphatase
MGGATAAALLLGAGPLHSLGARVALGQTPPSTTGYGPLVPKPAQNDPSMVLRLPAKFNFEVISRQGVPMSDGKPTPGIFDGTGSFAGSDDDVTILIRNHENRRRPGEIPVIVPPEKRYDPDPTYNGGDTKLVVQRRRAGRNPDGTRRYTYDVVRDFAILGGTETNCAGGVIDDAYWYTCEEVVNRSTVSGLKHGYNYAIPAYANEPVKAVPMPQQGRFVHEAVTELDGILYETEDRSIERVPDVVNPELTEIGSCFYRFIPDDDDDDDRRRGRDRFAGSGKLQALKLRDEFHANMDVGRVVGRPYRVEWVDIDEPDHDDDTDINRTSSDPRLTPTRIQAQRKGAAYFDRAEGIWTAEANIDDDGDDDDGGSGRSQGKVYFDCTAGGAQNLGQVWEYDPRRRTITLIFESTNPGQLEGPDNVVIVPRTGDIFLQEDASGTQFIRGLTPEGEIYDFAETVTNETEFCGGCFDADGFTLFVSQQGERSGNNPPGTTPSGPGELEGTPDGRAVTYAIYGPFEDRLDSENDEGEDDD